MNHLYGRLAMTNIKNNKQFYLPHLLAGMVFTMMFYIMRAIQGSEGLDAMRGSTTLKFVLSLGLCIVGICVCIFLFYTNAFVMKRRKKELGVYNILGMEKKHIAKVMAQEAVILYAVSVGGGLALGILFHKLATMFLYRLTGLSESIPFYISGYGCLQTAGFFAVVYALMLCYNFLQVKLANPIELLHGGNVGEREPKARWILALTGVICILTGYYLAITVYGVMEAVNMFFLAVILVIVGTYELFMTVSIAFLKLLKQNKRYYYKTAHFISVSGMFYRMKRNAVGLASICILSTMVLVMISTTVCMYAGLEDSLRFTFHKEIGTTLYFHKLPDDAKRNDLLEQLYAVADKQNRTVSDLTAYMDLEFTTYQTENTIELYDNASNAFSDMSILYAITKPEFETFSGTKLGDLTSGDVMVASSDGFEGDQIQVFGQEYHVAEEVDFPSQEMEDFLGNIRAVYLIVADDQELEGILEASAGMSEQKRYGKYHIELEVDGTEEQKKAYVTAIRAMFNLNQEQMDFEAGTLDSRTEQREIYLEMNGGFLFLGIFLGILFLMITVLIIYYKQISEGFEDRERFAILTKVGMSQDMVKAAIHTQVRTVFFMPLTVAMIHLAAAFPMLKLILLIFGLANTSLFVGCLIVTSVVFAAIYFLVFRLTSRSYYRIVYR